MWQRLGSWQSQRVMLQTAPLGVQVTSVGTQDSWLVGQFVGLQALPAVLGEHNADSQASSKPLPLLSPRQTVPFPTNKPASRLLQQVSLMVID